MPVACRRGTRPDNRRARGGWSTARSSRRQRRSRPVPSLHDIIKHEENGLLFKPKDPEDIAMAIERIVSDHELQKTVIKNSKKTLNEFLPETIAKQHLEIYQNLLKN